MQQIPRSNAPPRDVGENGLTPAEEADIQAIGEQPIFVFDLPDFHTKTKVIGIAYQNVRNYHRELPALLPSPQPSYELREAPGKGLGLFAQRSIAAGELILVERPLLFTPLWMPPGGRSVELYNVLWSRLDPQAQATVMSLKNVKNIHTPRFMGIIGTNGLQMKLNGGSERYGGVFPVTSRINHSCGPNTDWYFNSTLFVLCVKAVRPIPVGEEITLAYESLTIPRADRHFDLERKYKFTCTCKHCVNPFADSDKIRKLYGAGDFKTIGIARQLDRIKLERNKRKLFVRLVKKGLNILTIEGLDSGLYTIPYYHALIDFYGTLGDLKSFKYWGFKGLLLCTSDLPSGFRAVYHIDEWVDWLRDPKKNFPDWNTLNLDTSRSDIARTLIMNP